MQVRSTPLGLGQPSPATLLFNRPISGLMWKANRAPSNYNYDEDKQNTLQMLQGKMTRNNDTFKE